MHYLNQCRYCSRCHAELSGDDYHLRYGWCKNCVDTVTVSCCKVPYWILGAMLGMLWIVELGI